MSHATRFRRSGRAKRLGQTGASANKNPLPGTLKRIRAAPTDTMTREGRVPIGTEAQGGITTSDREGIDAGVYLRRIGLDPATVESGDLETIERIQGSHVTAVPFESLAIVGDPRLDRPAPGVGLSVPHLHEKIVGRERGGYCFELTGLFHCLLAALGYSIDRVAARITGGETVPATHHSNVVELDRRYVVDVGMVTPMLRVPVPIEGGARTDGRGGVARGRERPPRRDVPARVPASGRRRVIEPLRLRRRPAGTGLLRGDQRLPPARPGIDVHRRAHRRHRDARVPPETLREHPHRDDRR